MRTDVQLFKPPRAVTGQKAAKASLLGRLQCRSAYGRPARLGPWGWWAVRTITSPNLRSLRIYSCKVRSSSYKGVEKPWMAVDGYHLCKEQKIHKVLLNVGIKILLDIGQ